MSMSASSDFVKPDHDDITPSQSDGDLYTSDVESYTPTDRLTALDYWFGQKYFECIVAQNIFCGTAATSRSVVGIDVSEKLYCIVYLLALAPLKADNDVQSEFQQTTRNYPYKTVYDALRATLSSVRDIEYRSEEKDVYRAMLCIIGATIRLGDKEEKHELLNTIRKYSTFKCGNSDWSLPPLFGQYSTTNGSGGSYRTPQRPVAEESDPDSYQYTMTLKEMADQDCCPLPTYNYRRSPASGQFEATVSFGGHQFTGIGQNKKQARHLASKEACLYFQAHRGRPNSEIPIL